MSPGNRRSRSVGGSGFSRDGLADPSSEYAVDADRVARTDLEPLDVLDELAVVVGGTFVLVVELTGGRYRRRCFLTAAAAEKASHRALLAGHNAKVYLAELRPLWLLKGAEVTE